MTLSPNRHPRRAADLAEADFSAVPLSGYAAVSPSRRAADLHWGMVATTPRDPQNPAPKAPQPKAAMAVTANPGNAEPSPATDCLTRLLRALRNSCARARRVSISDPRTSILDQTDDADEEFRRWADHFSGMRHDDIDQR